MLKRHAVPQTVGPTREAASASAGAVHSACNAAEPACGLKG